MSLMLDSGDKIRGHAAAATVVDYTIHGTDANVIKQLSDGQLPSTIGDLYTADSIDVVTSIILVNTDSSARAVNLYLTPNGGTARRIIPKDLVLGVGYSLHTDGKTVIVTDLTGGTVTTSIALSDASPNTIEPDDSASAGTSTAASRSDHEHAIVAAATGTIDENANAEGSATSFARSDHNHQHTAALHENGGGAEISVTDLSGTLADDQHVIDAEAVSAVEAAGLTFAEDKGITLDIALADGSWNAILQVAGIADVNLDYGEAVYLGTDAEWHLARGNAGATVAPMTGIVAVAGLADAAVTVLIIGSIRADAAFPALTVGAAVFIDPDVAGDVTSANLTTDEFQKAIGWSPDANTIVLTGNPDWVKVG